ncbi:MAG: GIY-YIG nuclease family protein, partial [Clostridia bacterium]|nr:GIY-YIG nuclease family protein [Clostridia bacterium]
MDTERQPRKRDITALRRKAASLPRSPGVYIMRDVSGKIIYIGKSRSLRDRVSSYFHGAHDVKTEKMASSVADFSFITCDTEMEAFAMENSLIKQHTPRYNIKLKDAKSYPYIKVSVRDEYPRISMTRKRAADGSLYFGPYSSTSTVYPVISSLEKTFGIPSCSKKFPEDIGRGRPCVNYQIRR